MEINLVVKGLILAIAKSPSWNYCIILVHMKKQQNFSMIAFLFFLMKKMYSSIRSFFQTYTEFIRTSEWTVLQ